MAAGTIYRDDAGEWCIAFEHTATEQALSDAYDWCSKARVRFHFIVNGVRLTVEPPAEAPPPEPVQKGTAHA